MQVKYEARMAINYIQNLISKSKKLNTYFDQYSYIINDFKENPEKYNKQISPNIPDGSPIGGGTCYYNQ